MSLAEGPLALLTSDGSHPQNLHASTGLLRRVPAEGGGGGLGGGVCIFDRNLAAACLTRSATPMVLASCFALSGAMARRRGIDAKPDGERPRCLPQCVKFAALRSA
jgi:hypothetical protein